MNRSEIAYDKWLTTNHAEEEAARYEMALEDKFQEIRSSMDIHEYASDIESDCFGGIGEKEQSIHKALSEVFAGSDGSHLSRLIAQYASDWLDAKATRMAVDALSGGDE